MLSFNAYMTQIFLLSLLVEPSLANMVRWIPDFQLRNKLLSNKNITMPFSESLFHLSSNLRQQRRHFEIEPNMALLIPHRTSQRFFQQRLLRHQYHKRPRGVLHHTTTSTTSTKSSHTYRRWIPSFLHMNHDSNSNNTNHRNKTTTSESESSPLVPAVVRETESIVSSSTTSTDSWSGWIDRTMQRVIVSVITYVVIGQSIINIWKKVNQSDIGTDVANKLFSKESLDVVRTIQSILSNVHTKHGVVDVFGTYRTMDVLSSIVALSRLQRISKIEQERSLETERCQKNAIYKHSDNNNVDVKLIQELAHYAKYAHAAYGWSLDLALRWKLHFGGNRQALITLTGIHQNDIVEAEWDAKAPHRPAYFIVRDHAHHTIVLCIRGTWSVNDMLTNLYCTSSSNDDNSSHQLFHRQLSCHSGMLEAAKAVHNDTVASIGQELSNHPDYNLVLVGHSLGGGCAALLGKLYESRYPTLKVYLFGAPCVVPENNSMNKMNVISVIAKGDPFSCLSLGHVADVSTGIDYLCKDDVLRNEILLRTSEVMKHDKVKTDENNIEWCTSTMNMLRKRMTAEKLYPPGRILLLQKETSSTTASGPLFRLRWWSWRRKHQVSPLTIRDVPIQYFRDLLIGPNMFNLSKHLPSMYVSKLNDIASHRQKCRL